MTPFIMKSLALVLAGGTALTAVGLGSEGEAHETAANKGPGFSCAIVTRDLGGSVEISGTVRSERAISGDYDLKIRQGSSAGSSVIDQSGAFTARPGRTETLGETTLGGTRGHYTAELTLTVDGKRWQCRGADAHTDL